MNAVTGGHTAPPFPASLMPAFENALKQQRTELVQKMQPPIEAVVDIDRLQQEVAAVDDALGRLRRGMFGICTRCGENMAVAHLYAQPVAPCCGHCQTDHEQTAPESATRNTAN